MVTIVVVPSYLGMTHAFGKLLPNDRSALPNNKQKSIVIPKLLAGFTILMVLYLEVIGLSVYSFSMMPDVFDIEKT